MRGRQIELSVDELVVDGLDRSARDALAEMLRRRLGELIAERGLPGSNGAGGSVSRPTVTADLRVTVSNRVEILGAELAEALYRGLES